MVYTKHYISLLGGILLSADEVGLTGLWFDGEKYYAENLPEEQYRGGHFGAFRGCPLARYLF